MYNTKIKDITTITWHNLHFLLEYYSTEILSTVEAIILEGEKKASGDTAKGKDIQTLQEIKTEVIATVKTLRAMHTVVEHYRTITSQKEAA